MMIDKTTTRVHQLAASLKSRHIVCGVAESCTGGLLAAHLTAVAGSSEWFDGGFVTYSNESKQRMLKVPAMLLTTFGAVSAETVRAMAQGVLHQSLVHTAVAISGIAGPSGGSVDKPVGTVWIAWIYRGHGALAKRFLLNGDRQHIRQQAVDQALSGWIDYLDTRLRSF